MPADEAFEPLAFLRRAEALIEKLDPAGEPAIGVTDLTREPHLIACPNVASDQRHPKTGKREAIIEQAQAGALPAAPNFSKPTHARFRAKLAKLVTLAQAGDAEGLKAIEINPVSTSPKAMARYRDLAVIAIEARAVSRKAA